jgi:hypothetical protein
VGSSQQPRVADETMFSGVRERWERVESKMDIQDVWVGRWSFHVREMYGSGCGEFGGGRSH